MINTLCKQKCLVGNCQQRAYKVARVQYTLDRNINSSQPRIIFKKISNFRAFTMDKLSKCGHEFNENTREKLQT